MARIFVICAGRCGSKTFSKACNHIVSYSSAHESRVGCNLKERVNYPDDHIEIDNRLLWFLPLLEEKYGDDAYYVYLKRDLKKIAKSYYKRWSLKESIVKAFGYGILMQNSIRTPMDRFKGCLYYSEYADHIIRVFIKNKKNVMIIDISDCSVEFPIFWNWIQCHGNLNEALLEFNKIYNRNKSSFLKRLIFR